MIAVPINPWLEEKLKKREEEGGKEQSPEIGIVVEVPKERESEALSNLAPVTGVVEVRRTLISRTPTRTFIPVLVESPSVVYNIEQALPYAKIHYDMPKYITSFGLPETTLLDPLIGEIHISAVEIPGFKVAFPTGPIGILAPPVLKEPDVSIIPTSVTKDLIVDIKTTLTGRGVPVAVLDTGAPMVGHPQFLFKIVRMFTTVPELPIDMMGHGSWCSSCICGNSTFTRFGDVVGVAPGADLINVKCLSTAGFGTTAGILKAMEIAQSVGAKIVSMSLGGPLQGSVDEDPDCVAIEEYTRYHNMIFIVAAGNEGPGHWTIASPGASPYAITVGAYSPLYAGVGVFSSRGHSAPWYKKNRLIWERDYSKYGKALAKPDVLSPGGGPVKEGDIQDLIYSGVNGWFDGFYDRLIDSFEAMRGTSMATPHFAGLVTLLAQANPKITTEWIKKYLEAKGHPKSIEDGHGLAKLSWFIEE